MKLILVEFKADNLHFIDNREVHRIKYRTWGTKAINVKL